MVVEIIDYKIIGSLADGILWNAVLPLGWLACIIVKKASKKAVRSTSSNSLTKYAPFRWDTVVD